MTKQVQRRRGTATQHTSFTGAEGEISVNTTNKSVHVHDGVTAGGFEAARADLGNVSDASLNTALAGNTLSSLTITSADINGGTIDGTVIGGTTPAAVTGTTLTATTSATLQHSASTKLATTSTGVDVTGTVTADALTVDGSSTLNTSGTGILNYNYLGANKGGVTTDGISVYQNAVANMYFNVNSANRMLVAGNGDISFYEDTGTTPKFFWDASAEALGIGTSSPSVSKLHLNYNSVNNRGIRLQDENGTYDLITSGGGNANSFGIYNDTAGAYRLFINSSGNVGIGTSSPAGKLHVAGSVVIGNANAYNELTFSGTEYTNIYSETTSGFDIGTNSTSGSSYLRFLTENTERLRIDSSGRVGIGTSSPQTSLHIGSASNKSIRLDTATSNATFFSGWQDAAQLGVNRDPASGVFTDGTKAAATIAAVGEAGNAYIVFNTTGTNNTAPPERMRIDASGNVGIGTSSPSEKLHVVGTIVGQSNDHYFGNYSSGAYVDIGNLATSEMWLDTRSSTLTDVPLNFRTKGSGAIKFTVGTTERMRIDSSGKVGIGMSSPGHTLDVTGAAGTFAGLRVNASSFQNTGFIANRVNNGNTAALYFTESGANQAYVISYGSAYGSGLNGALQIVNGSNALTFDSSGNLGLGVVPSGWSSGNNTALQIRSSGFVQQDVVTNVGLGRNAYQSGSWYYTANGYAQMLNLESGGAFMFFQAGSGTAGNAVSFTQAMTLDASGNLLVGTTTTADNNANGHLFYANGTAHHSRSGDAALRLYRPDSNGDVAQFRQGANFVGSISVTATSTSYNTSSDYRLKEDIQPLTGASDRVLSLNPVNFAWKADGSRTDGFIAHEAQAVAPYAVTGEKDGEEMQSIDHSKLVPLLTAALQEALTEIANLKARVAALEA